MPSSGRDLWAAINGLGAGGGSSPYYANAANCILVAIQGLVCVFDSALVSRPGMRWVFAPSMIGFPIYTASLYAYVKYGNNWFLIPACIINGTFSGIF